MKKPMIIGIIIAVVAIIVFGGLILMSSGNAGVEDLGNIQEVMTKINTDVELPIRVSVTPLDTANADMVKAFTGITDASVLEEGVVSEALIMSQAHSAFLVKVKKGTNVEDVKKQMLDNLDMRKWICVSAEKLYIVNSGDYIFTVMSSKEFATDLLNQFKVVVENKIGTVLEKDAVAPELGGGTPVGPEPLGPPVAN